ncbi:MAG TPA: hypothetical protein PK280_13130 [Planctomycetota bacterium]|nr:hypothetical protein [Planctomycetota bacterium]
MNPARTVDSSSLRLCGAAVAVVLLLAGGCAPREGGAQPYAVGLVRADGRTGARLAVRPGTVVVLDGSQSGLAGSEPAGRGDDGVRLAWRWRQVSGPKVGLARADLSATECRPVIEGLYIFSLVASSGGRESLPVLVEVEVRRDAPAGGEGGAGERGQGDRPAVRRPEGQTAEFALLESSLEELIRVFPARTGITLRVDPEWMRPEGFRARRLSFMARDVGPETALELAARLAGADFVRDRRDSALLSAGLGWMRSAPQEARFYAAPAGLIPPGGDSRAIEEILGSACRPALFACPDSSVQWQAGLNGVNVVGPASIHDRVCAIMAALVERNPTPPPEPPATDDEKLRDAVLTRPVDVRLVHAELSEAALELGRLLGVPLAWEEPAGAERRAMPRVSVDGRGRPAAEVLAEVARQAGLQGHSWVRGGAVWLYRREPRAGSAESAWGRAVVRSYPARWLEDRGVLPGAFILAVRKRVCPESWTASTSLIAYYKDTGRILVVNAPEVHDELVRLMYELTRKPTK